MSEKFTLNILGTASAKPNRNRASSAQLLQAAGRLFLIDCSEDTQRRILFQNDRLREWESEHKTSGLKRISSTGLDAIFISHIHGDHMFGLFPILSTMALNGRTKSIDIIGPSNLGPILNFYKSYWGVKDPFRINFIPLKDSHPQTVLDFPDLEVMAFPLNHGVATYGFLFREKFPTSLRHVEYAARSFAYCSDTAPFPQLAQWVKGVDLLYHEATYLSEDWRKAADRFHSTTVDAAKCALEAGAGRLIAAHYSSSIKEEQIHEKYQEQMRDIFKESFALDDGDILDLPLQMPREFSNLAE